MNLKIKIYIVNHFNFKAVSNPLFFPIQVGAVLNMERFKGMLTDDTGDNISEKNGSYCELTAQYWAWKNDEADYYGFFHYRRYLSFNKLNNRPYFYLKTPNEKAMVKLGFNTDMPEKIIINHDIIVPIAEKMYESVYNYYKQYHYIHDFDLIINIIKIKYPQYESSMSEYIQGKKEYFGNMFIMKRDIFFNYCNWLFDILAEYEKRADKSGYNKQEMRAEGFLGEWLFGVYYTQLIKDKNIKSIELPRVDFLVGNKKLKKNRFFYFLFPPESKRRFLLKRLYLFKNKNTNMGQ